jgi:hypothetical protein
MLTISPQFQVVIPKEAREFLKLRPVRRFRSSCSTTELSSFLCALLRR